MAFTVPNALRVRSGPAGTTDDYGNNGVFVLPHPNRLSKLKLLCLASDGAGWEHVSVSLPTRCPTWGEMCYVKMVFWGHDDTVLQYHPPPKEYVNNHPHCLHLWRPVGGAFPAPPAWMVGDKSRGSLKPARAAP